MFQLEDETLPQLACISAEACGCGSKNLSVGADVRDDFAARKTCSWSGNHRNSFLVLSSGRSGPSSLGLLVYVAANWLVKAHIQIGEGRKFGYCICDC